jgi:Prenyltransferase and squalene oxidase repeat
VSWPLASFAIVIGVLLAGWLAYERSRPSARMVAVVGTLAGLAALGRDAFAALPDVKPITAMTFVVGYGLGPLPGFTVGAIGMLASNVLLGEGSYTPWQMAAWGAVGLAGAALAAATRRRAGRLTLAFGCALSAAAAKETMNLYTWSLGASHTPAALLAVAGTALPFDVTDVLASFLFGLAFAPQLARLLGRMRVRMTVTWQEAAPPTALALVCVATLLPGALTTARAASTSTAHEVAFLLSAQNADGGFGAAPRQPTSELYSAWAALGLAAAGIDPARVVRDGHSVLDALRAQASTLQGVGDLERTILALRACGAPPSLPGRGDLLGELARYRSADGSYGELVDLTSFAVLALRAGGRPVDDPLVRSAAAWLQGQQSPSGGFGYASHGGAADVDDTGSAIQALAAAGAAASPTVARAAAYLERAVNRDGGLPQQPGAESNAQSTAWAIQGLIAAGRSPAARPPHALRSPLAYLESLRMPDGAVRYSQKIVQTPVWVTAQALTALAGRALPIAPAHAGPPRGRAPSATAPSRTRTARLGARTSVSASQRSSARGASSPPGGPRGGRSVASPAVLEARLNALARAAGMLLALVLRRC